MLTRILSAEFGDKVVDVLSRYSQVVSQAVSFIRWCEREPGKIQSYGADVVGEFSDLEDAGGSGRNYLATWTRRGPVGAVPGRLPPTVVPHGCDAAVPVSERAGGGGRPSEAMAVPPQHADAHTPLAAHALPAPALGQHAEEFVKGEPPWPSRWNVRQEVLGRREDGRLFVEGRGRRVRRPVGGRRGGRGLGARRPVGERRGGGGGGAGLPGTEPRGDLLGRGGGAHLERVLGAEGRLGEGAGEGVGVGGARRRGRVAGGGRVERDAGLRAHPPARLLGRPLLLGPPDGV